MTQLPIGRGASINDLRAHVAVERARAFEIKGIDRILACVVVVIGGTTWDGIAL